MIYDHATCPKLKSILFSRSPNSPVVDVSLAQCTTFSTSNAVHFNDAAARSDVRTTVLWQKVDQGRRPRRLRSTRRAGVALESRRALCWHRPPVLLPRGATRAKLCKCCQGQTPQNFDRVLAAACLYRDMLLVIRCTAVAAGPLRSAKATLTAAAAAAAAAAARSYLGSARP